MRNFRVSDFRIDSSGFVVCKATVSCEDNSIGSGYFCSNNSVRQLRIKSVNGERMNGRQAVLWCICTTYLVSALFVVPYSTPLMAQTASGAPNAASQATTGEPDGQHDFDFAIGDWKIHLKRLEHPLTGSKTWVEFDGTLKTRKIWNGDGDVEEFDATSPTGLLTGLAVRLYNPQSHQWSIYWANKKNGAMDSSPQVGQFKNGRGEFYGTDTLNGKFIIIRFVWTNTHSDSPHFEQSFSDDGGKTWEVNWITDQTRVKAQ